MNTNTWHFRCSNYNNIWAGWKTSVHRKGVGIPRHFFSLVKSWSKIHFGRKDIKLLYRWSWRLWRLWISFSILYCFYHSSWAVGLHTSWYWRPRTIPYIIRLATSRNSYRTSYSSRRSLWTGRGREASKTFQLAFWGQHNSEIKSENGIARKIKLWTNISHDCGQESP